MNLYHPNTSYLKHFIVALLICIWLSFFLVFIAPFDASDLSFKIRIILLPPYGLIAAMSYLILIPFQNLIQQEFKKWNTSHEIIFIVIYALIGLVGSYSYYKSSIINGTYAFPDFLFGQFFPILFILLPILILSRWLLYKRTNNLVPKTIILKGNNKLDVLKLELPDLICICGSTNYIEVNYTQDQQLQKKLLRTTLTKIHSAVPSLIKVHRSYLINPVHFKDWKNAKTIHLTKMEVPVSKKYRNVVLSLN